MTYQNWNYDFTNWMDKDTQQNIISLYDSKNTKDIKDFFYWIQTNKPEYSFFFRDLLVALLLEREQFELGDEFFNNKMFVFDKKISEQCVFYLSLNFKEKFFDYWVDKVKQLPEHEQHSSYKKFWQEFLSYQFLRSDEVLNNLPNLDYVFNKIPFYIKSNYDIVNGYLINARTEFFKNGLSNLDTELKPIILQKFAVLCGQHYADFTSTFQEEFQKFPHILDIFNKTKLYTQLDDKFDSKTYTKKSKI